MLDLPIITGAVTYASAKVTDNIVAIIGISLILIAAMGIGVFDSSDMFALTMSAITAISALAGYEVGKRSGQKDNQDQ